MILMVILHKLICKFKGILVSILAGIIVELDKWILRFIWKCEGSQIAKAILKKYKTADFIRIQDLLSSYIHTLYITQHNFGNVSLRCNTKIQLPKCNFYIQNLEAKLSLISV